MDTRAIIFPDKKFKEYLVLNFDKDNDGEISLTEALTIEKLNLIGNCRKGYFTPDGLNITSLEGIEYLINLKRINCGFNKLTHIDLNRNTKLEQVSCNNNFELSCLKIENCVGLRYLNVNQTAFKELNLINNINLEQLYCGNIGQLTSLNLNRNTLLKQLSCYYNLIEYIDLSNNTYLEEVRIGHNKLKTLDLKRNKEIKRLYCDENQLEILDLSENKKLEILECRDNDLKTIDLIRNKKLIYLNCMSNELLENVIIDDDFIIKELHSNVKPLTSNRIKKEREYRKERENDTYAEYNGTYAQDIMGFSDQTISDAFEGDPEACWNVD